MSSAGNITFAVSAVLVLLRLIVYDSLCILPVQPVSLLLYLCSVWHRVLVVSELHDLYVNYLSFYFEGDFTPVLLLLSYITLWLQGSLKKDILWSSRRRKVLTTILFVIAPLITFHRFVVLHMHRNHLQETIHGTFGNETTLMNFDAEDPIYSITHSVFNKHGRFRSILPDKTFTYKTFKPSTNLTGRCAGGIHRYLENQVHHNRVSMENGFLELDVYLPKEHESGQLHPIVMFVHGGAWRGGDRHFLSLNYRKTLPHMLEQGFIFVSVSYRLRCTGAHVEDMVEDLEHAVEFISEHAKSWGGDGDHIIPYGASAGGHLSLVLSYSNKYPQIRGVISAYGPTDLREDGLYEVAASFHELVYLPFYVKHIRQLCDKEGDENLECFENNSPVALVHKNAPPTLLIHGTKDALVPISQARRLAKELSVHGVKSALIEIPCARHSCDVHCSSPCSQGANYAIERFLFDNALNHRR
mmetsp:Transcript_12022/g.13833  ORF Transcript_12022/g.13833 Transcript_12022/m.13833 type:complete len:471 (+) Transcript_12022:238-1650(+)